jgi:hypothetical protein
MNVKVDKLLKLESELVSDSKAPNSPRSFGNNLVINFIESPSNLSSSRNQNIESIIKEINDDNNQKNILNKTSSFPMTNESHNNSKLSSLISKKNVFSKLNSINEQISFKPEGFKYSLIYNDNHSINNNLSKENTMKIIEEKHTERSIKSFKNKNLLNPETIPLYTQQMYLKSFNDFVAKKHPVVYSEKTVNGKIFGFSAFTFDNNSDSQNKITININLETQEENAINYFSLYKKSINKDILCNLISLKTQEQIKIIHKIKDELYIVKSQNDYFTILSNIESKNKKQNYISILSSNDSNTVKMLYNHQKIPYDETLDFLILMDKGIFKYVYCIEINYIIYDVLKSIISNEESFEEFLKKIILYIFEQTIMNGGKNEMSIIFICFKRFKDMFDNKDINKIDKILSRLEKTTYEVDCKILNYYKKYTDNETNSPFKIKTNNYFNLTFKKTLTPAELDTVVKKKKKKKSFFKCCGI